MSQNDPPELEPCPWCKVLPVRIEPPWFEFEHKHGCYLRVLLKTNYQRVSTENVHLWNTRSDLAAPDALALLMRVRAALQLLLSPIRSVRQGESDDASIPVQLRAGDIKQAREALRKTADDTYKVLSNPDAVRQA